MATHAATVRNTFARTSTASSHSASPMMSGGAEPQDRGPDIVDQQAFGQRSHRHLAGRVRPELAGPAEPLPRTATGSS